MKGCHSTLIAEGTKKLKPQTLARNMSKDSLQRFEYQKQRTLNDNRFMNLKLPSIASSNRKAPNIVPNYSKQRKEPSGARSGLDNEDVLKDFTDRSYSVNYSLV